MKIVLGINNVDPNRFAGTEYFVYSLAQSLVKRGIEVIVLAPRSELGLIKQSELFPVYFFGKCYVSSREEITGEREPENLASFSEVLAQIQPDVFHLHSLSSQLGAFHLKTAKALGVSTICSLHVPHWFCTRGDFMQKNLIQCGGALSDSKCNNCARTKKFSSMGDRLIKIFYDNFRLSKLYSIPGFEPAVIKLNTFNLCVDNCDGITVFAGWQKKLLLSSGYNPDKIYYSRQGVRSLFAQNNIRPKERSGSSLIRVGYYGRFAEEKGIDFFIKAICDVKRIDMEFSIVGNADSSYTRKFNDLMEVNSRVETSPALDGGQLLDWMLGLDVICVPSIIAETGPLATMEALSLGIPVVAFDIGGNSDLIRDNVNGRLINNISPESLVKAFSDLNWSELENWKKHSKYGRTMDHVADDMLEIYNIYIK